MRKCEFDGSEYILVTYKDVHNYFMMQNTLIERFVSKFISSRLQYDCISEIPMDSPDFDLSYIKTCVRWAVIKNPSNPLMGLNQAVNDLQEVITNMVVECDLLINKSGGYQPIHHYDDLENIRDFVFCEHKVLIRENTKYLNLENDNELESDAINYLESVDDNYSYVLNLRSYGKETLTNIFREFYSFGGNYIYVYTTGSDIDQMKFYIQCAIEAHKDYDKFGFIASPIFYFEFSGIVTDELSDYMYTLEVSCDVKVVIVGGSR